MNNPKIGNIPRRLTYFSRPPESVHFSWDDIDEPGEAVSVQPTYVSDATNSKTLETGRNWAERPGYDRVTGEYVPQVAEVLIRENDPIDSVKIVTLELRSKGGRAYKVLIGGRYYVDLREDVLLDLILTNGVSPGGVVNGPFVWARVGSEMKLIRVGSLLHTKMIEATRIDNAKPLVPEIGGVYENKKGDRFVYLGQYWTNDLVVTTNRVSWLCTTTFVNAIKPRELVHVYHDSFLLKYADKNPWYETEDRRDSYVKKGDPTARGFYITKAPSFKIKVGQMEVPNNYVEDTIRVKTERNREYYAKDQRNVDAGLMIDLIAHARNLYNLSKHQDRMHPTLASLTQGTTITTT